MGGFEDWDGAVSLRLVWRPIDGHTTQVDQTA